MVCPEMERAVQTIPAMAITKNIPVVPERPKRNNTVEEMMMVSIVIPETGLRAVVAMALAATEVKKNEKSSVNPKPTATTVQETGKYPKKAATPIAPNTTPRRTKTIGRSRSVRSVCAASPWRKVRNAVENDPATTRSDLK